MDRKTFWRSPETVVVILLHIKIPRIGGDIRTCKDIIIWPFHYWTGGSDDETIFDLSYISNPVGINRQRREMIAQSDVPRLAWTRLHHHHPCKYGLGVLKSKTKWHKTRFESIVTIHALDREIKGGSAGIRWRSVGRDGILCRAGDIFLWFSYKTTVAICSQSNELKKVPETCLHYVDQRRPCHKSYYSI